MRDQIVNTELLKKESIYNGESIINTSGDSELITSFGNEYFSNIVETVGIENTTREYLSVDKIIKKIKRIHRLGKPNTITKLIDNKHKTLIIATRQVKNTTHEDNVISSLNILQKNIEALANSVELENLNQKNKRKISIYRKELIRYNKKKFTYWFVVNNE